MLKLDCCDIRLSSCVFSVFSYHLHRESYVQVEAEKCDLQLQLECVGGDAGWLSSRHSETASYQPVEVVMLMNYICLIRPPDGRLEF